MTPPATPLSLLLGATRIELHPSGLTVTHYPDGTSVPAYPHDTPDYLARARAHGYGDDVALMSREHEIVHTLLAYLTHGGPSSALWGVAHGLASPPEDGVEEAAVLAFQGLLRARGVSVMSVVERLREGR